MERHVMKQHDLEPRFEVQLADGTGEVDLLNAVAVTFIMRNRVGIKIKAPMTITDQSIVDNRGVVFYDWVLGDTDVTGSFTAEIQVTWPGGRPQTFPGDTYLTIQFVKDLDQAGAV